MQAVAQLLPRRASEQRACQMQERLRTAAYRCSLQRSHTVEALQSKNQLASIDTLAHFQLSSFSKARQANTGQIRSQELPRACPRLHLQLLLAP